MFRKLLVFILTLLCVIDVALLWSKSDVIEAHLPAEEVGLAPEIVSPDTLSPSELAAGLVEIRRPDSIVDALTAAGTIELISKRQVVLQVDGIVSQVAVKVGDPVTAGTLLMALDTTDLERAVSRMELDLATAQADLQKLQDGSSPAEIAAAEANLKAAQENLARVQAGATPEEIAAAESRLYAAQAKYNETQAPPSGAELDEVNAELEKAEIARQAAQRAYDKIKWRNDKGMTMEAAELYKATVEYERVQAKFNRINVGASQSSVQDAVSNIRKAEAELEQLKLKPTPADLAEAEAKVSDAEQKLSKLTAGASGAELQSAEAKVKKAQLDLADAQTKLRNAQILSPIDGTVLELSITPGERGTVGKMVATLADTSQLKLTVKVAEVDITKITIDQPVQIAIDAIRGRIFAGIVDSIAPINQSDKDVVNYPVTIRLTDTDLASVRPGMNAVATLTDETVLENRWLVPTTALHRQTDGSTLVMILQGETLTPVAVTAGEAQGEWTLVQSSDLRPGDKVQGSLASYVDQPSIPGADEAGGS